MADISLEIAEAIGNVTTIRTGAAIALGARREAGETVDAGDARPLGGFKASNHRSTSGRSSTCC